LYCPVSANESQIKEVRIDLFEHFDFSPEKFKILQGNDKTLPYLINYLESNELPLSQKLARRI
jgi:nicotinic acid phosphoribosyltransferase